MGFGKSSYEKFKYTSLNDYSRIQRKFYYENTHYELLLTKQFMNRLGLKSANIVSSPYHMRRIKIIAEKVFKNNNYKIAIVASRFQEAKEKNWWLKKKEIKWVSSEYIKIAWFLIYSPFCKQY